MSPSQRAVDYLRANLGKYSLESLRQVLLQGGVSAAEIDEAVLIVSAPPPVDAAPPPVVAGNSASAADAVRDEAFRALSPLQKAKSLLLTPNEFYRMMPRAGGLRDPIIYMVIMILIAQAISLGLGVGLRLAGSPLSGSGIGMMLALILGGIMSLFVLPLAVAGISLVSHLIWTLMGSKQHLETSFRCLAYMSPVIVLHAAAQAVPLIGIWLAIPVMFYLLFLYVPASAEVHEVKRSHALAVFGVFSFLIIGSMTASAFAIWKLKAVAKELGQGGPAGFAQMQKLAETLAKTPGANLNFQMQSGSAADGGADVQTIDAAQLTPLLPESAGGIARSSAKTAGSRLGALKFSEAVGEYVESGGRRISIRISDAGSMAGMLAMAWKSVAVEEESAEGFERTLDYQGHPAHERFRSSGGVANFEMVAFGRFLIKAEGRQVTMDEVREAVGRIPLDRLGALAN